MRPFLIIALVFSSALYNPSANADSLNEQAVQSRKKILAMGPRFSITGKIVAGKETPYSIRGVDFSMAKDVVSIGKFRLGATAQVRGLVVNGKKVAKKVVVSSEPSPRSNDRVQVEETDGLRDAPPEE